MNRIYLTILFSVFLTACGSSDDNHYYSDGTIGDIQGDWISNCRTNTDGTSTLLTYTFDTSNSGNDFFVSGYSTYDTSNCRGTSEITILGGDVFYSGEQATSVCIAEKVDLFVTSADDGDIIYEGAELDDFLEDNELSDSAFDIACTLGNRMFLGLNSNTLDGSSNATRPTEMDTSIPYHPTSFRAAKAAKDSISSIETAKARIKLLLQSIPAE